MTFRNFALGLSTMVLLAACGSGEEEARAADQDDTAAGVARTASADELSDLSALLDFSAARDCEWSAAANSAFEDATVFGDDYVTRPGTVTIPGVEEPVTARLERPFDDAPDFIRYFLDFEGQWLGLKVTGLTDAFIEEGDGVWGKGIRFDASVAEVASALAEAGFDVDPNGGERERELSNEGGDRVIMATSVAEVEGETVFYCNQPYIFEGQTFSY